MSELEKAACTPVPIDLKKFNENANLPFGLKIEHVQAAMQEWIDFIGFINTQLNSKELERLESILMPANFSSMVGEFLGAAIPKHCPTLAKNEYHNGHPDMIPDGKYPKNSVQHAGADGIEIKASRYDKGWQGHNAEDCWLMVAVFDSSRPVDPTKGIDPMPFRYRKIFLGHLEQSDWKFAGRSETSRRTITASVTTTGYNKMVSNWIYDEDYEPDDDLFHKLNSGI